MMQAHVRHVERLSNFMSPVGLSISHYTGSHKRKRQRFLTNPTGTNIGSSEESKTDPNASNTASTSSPNPTRSIPQSSSLSSSTNSIQQHTSTENQWTRERLSLRHIRNRSLFYNNAHSNDTQVNRENNEIMNKIIDKLLIYGYETSADIAKMQPWQLRVLKKEIPQIDYIFMTAYSMWGKKEYYDDHQNMSFRQFWDPSVWLQYNEIELIIKCFDSNKRGYRCMICATSHGLYDLDQLRWHIWLEHKDSTQLSMEMQASKKHYNDFEMPLKNLKLPSLVADDSNNAHHTRTLTLGNHKNNNKKTPVVSLLDSSDDDIDLSNKNNARKQRNNGRYSIRARQYNSKRRNNNNKSQSPDVSIISASSSSKQNGQRKRRRRNANNNTANQANNNGNAIQNPIIINGNNTAINDAIYGNNNNNASNNDDHAFMPSTNIMSLSPNRNKNAKTSSSLSLDTVCTTTMDMDDEFGWNNDNLSLNGFDDHEFSMIGYDDFGAFGTMNRQSSGSLGNINNNISSHNIALNSAFVDDTSLPSLQDSFMNEMSVSDPNFSFNNIGQKRSIHQAAINN